MLSGWKETHALSPMSITVTLYPITGMQKRKERALFLVCYAKDVAACLALCVKARQTLVPGVGKKRHDW